MLDHLAEYTLGTFESEDEYPEVLDRKIGLIESKGLEKNAEMIA